MSPRSPCPLCEAARLTTWYYADETCWVADCVVCRVPMVVWRVHDASPPPAVRHELRERLSVVAEELLVGRRWIWDDHMRQIPDHYHAHARAEAGTSGHVER